MTDVADTVEPAIEPALRAEALESLLLERGLVDTQTIETFIRTYETAVGPMNGAKVVAKAWTDPEYKQRLLADGTAAQPSASSRSRNAASIQARATTLAPFNGPMSRS